MTIKAYKGFNKDWTCTPNGKPFQYAVGETYKHDGPVTRCGVGFHSCENPFDVLKYYDTRNGNRFAEVEVGGQTARGNNDTKIASAEITIKAELKLPELFARGVAYLVDAGKALHRDMMKTHTETMTVAVANGNATSGYGANSATSGTRANSATSGEGANSATSGYGANSATSGYGANSATSGYGANSATSGTRANSATSGEGANSATSGDGANSATSGEGANSATSGTRANSATSGEGANSATSGYGANSATSGEGANSATSGTRANSATSGEGANSATCGAWCNSSVKGENAIAAALGPNSTASAEEGGAIMLAHYADDGTLKHVFASKVGKNGIKPGVTYKLNSRGKPVEAK